MWSAVIEDDDEDSDYKITEEENNSFDMIDDYMDMKLGTETFDGFKIENCGVLGDTMVNDYMTD